MKLFLGHLQLEQLIPSLVAICDVFDQNKMDNGSDKERF